MLDKPLLFRDISLELNNISPAKNDTWIDRACSKLSNDTLEYDLALIGSETAGFMSKMISFKNYV